MHTKQNNKSKKKKDACDVASASLNTAFNEQISKYEANHKKWGSNFTNYLWIGPQYIYSPSLLSLKLYESSNSKTTESD